MINLKQFYDAAVTAQTAKIQKAMEIQKCFENGETEKGLTMKKDLDELTKKAKDAEELYLSMRDAAGSDDQAKNFIPAVDREKAEEAKDSDILKSNEYTKAFFKALGDGVSVKEFKKMGVPEGMEILMKALTETGGTPAGADGGFLLPVDFNNMIIERARQFYDLAQDVNVENVQAFSGWRAIETTTQAEPFAQLTVDGTTTIPLSNQPAFAKLPYQVRDYGGRLPVANDLLSDSIVNLMTYLSKWLGKKVVLTHNSLILPFYVGLTPTEIALANQKTTLDAVKTALNKTLDPDVSVNSTIITNQSGFDVLDGIKDEQGRPLLQPDPTAASRYLVKGRPIKMLADRLLPNYVNAATKHCAPIYIGDGKSFVTLFERAGLEMASTNIGGSAWETNNTEIRGIMRDDCKQADAEAACAIGIVLE